jgi:hypothetical protein
MLIERFMGLQDDGSPPGEGYDLKIPVHIFFSACSEIIASRLTVAQVKALIWLPTNPTAPAMRTSPNDQAEFDALIALAPGAGNPAGRALYLESVHGILMLAEWRMAGYDTPALVRTKLGI